MAEPWQDSNVLTLRLLTITTLVYYMIVSNPSLPLLTPRPLWENLDSIYHALIIWEHYFNKSPLQKWRGIYQHDEKVNTNNGSVLGYD